MNGACPKFSALYGSRKNNFNFLRLFFALCVILSHSYPIIHGDKTPEPLDGLTRGQINLGALAVDAFFMISGFLLVGSWENSPGVLNFSARRVLRIYPGLIACICFCVFVAGPLGGANLHSYFTDPKTYRLFEYVFMRNFWNSVPSAFPGNPMPEVINSSLWTIKFEIFCYICLVILGLLRMLRPVPLLFIFLAVFLYYCALLERGGHPFIHFEALPKILNDFVTDPMPRFLSYFLAGSLFYVWRDRIPHSAALAAMSVVIVAISNYHMVEFSLPVFGGYALLYLALTPRVHLAWFDRVDLSYGVYLYAWPVQQLVLHWRWPGSGNPILLSLLVLPLVFSFAALSWHYVEKPSLSLKRQLLKKTRSQGDAINP